MRGLRNLRGYVQAQSDNRIKKGFYINGNKSYYDSGYDVKVSEVHGMSQRGGSVVTYVKYGDKVYSPVIEKGEADLILSFEELEAARWLPYLKKGGRLVLNTQRINPEENRSGHYGGGRAENRGGSRQRESG